MESRAGRGQRDHLSRAERFAPNNQGGRTMVGFSEVHPSLDNYWRAIILFGRNVASYKFAFGKSLLEVAQQGKSFVPLTELALPFARHIADHLKLADKQATFRSSQFL